MNYTPTDTDVNMVVEAIYGPADHPAPSPEVNAFGGRLRRKATAVLDVLVAAGWRPPSATGAVIHPTHAEQVAYDEGYAQGRTAVAEEIADALDAELKHGAPAMSPAYHSGYRDAARYVRNRGAEAGRG
jgi:hypothetical protein